MCLDLLWLDTGSKKKAPVLHSVDMRAHFQNAIFLKGESARNVWDAFVEAWATVYTGYPQSIKSDHGSLFTSKDWENLTDMAGIQIEISGIESHNSISVGERYHEPLRRIFTVILHEYPKLDREIALRCAVKGINDTMGPEGLVPSYLVFGVIPNFPAIHTKLPTQHERMAAISTARREMATITAKLRIQTALRSKLPPATDFHLKPGEEVYVFREKKGWTGPFKIIKIEGKQIYVNVNNESKKFHIAQTLPITSGTKDNELKRLHKALKQFGSNPPPGIFMTETILPNDPRAQLTEFKLAKMKELEGLAKRGAFEIILKDDVPQNSNILGGRFVLTIKNKGTNKEIYKARFVVQGHKDKLKGNLVHHSTNLKQSSIRLLLCLAAMFNFDIWSQDVSQAYLQSAENLTREIFVNPPDELRLGKDKLLKLLKPLYGLTDSGDYWFSTFTSHVANDLTMRPCISDAALFFKEIHAHLSGLIGTYVDDTIGAGNSQFREKSKVTEQRFESKKREEGNFKFAGIKIETIGENKFKLSQSDFAKRIKPLNEKADFETFRSKRQELSWLVNTRPDIACAVNKACQVKGSEFSKSDVININKIISTANKHFDRGLIQHKLDPETLHIVVFTDSGFANTSGEKSQLGFLVLLRDKSGKCNIIYFRSYKSRRVSRSVLGSEIYAFADGFDYAYGLKADLELMIKKIVPITILTDSKCLFDIITKSSTTSEKRLMIDLAAINEAYKLHEISKIGHISTQKNPANSLTKIAKSDQLLQIMNEGKIDIEVNIYVERKPLQPASSTSRI